MLNSSIFELPGAGHVFYVNIPAPSNDIGDAEPRERRVVVLVAEPEGLHNPPVGYVPGPKGSDNDGLYDDCPPVCAQVVGGWSVNLDFS